MAERAWKATERQIAKRVGGRRVPVSGRAGNPDVAADGLALEVKLRRRLPAWLKRAVAQAARAAGPDLAVVVLHEAGARHDDDLVVLRLEDFLALWAGRRPGSDTGAGP